MEAITESNHPTYVADPGAEAPFSTVVAVTMAIFSAALFFMMPWVGVLTAGAGAIAGIISVVRKGGKLNFRLALIALVANLAIVALNVWSFVDFVNHIG